MRFFVNDVISGGLLGQPCLALGKVVLKGQPLGGSIF